MAISEFEIKRCEKLVGTFIENNRPPPHIRKQLDLSFRIKNQSIEIFGLRSLWNNPDKIIEEMQAKATYVKKTKTWKVYWQRADLKWHSYQPTPEVDTLEDFLTLVSKDEHYCFKG